MQDRANQLAAVLSREGVNQDFAREYILNQLGLKPQMNLETLMESDDRTDIDTEIGQFETLWERAMEKYPEIKGTINSFDPSAAHADRFVPAHRVSISE